jgi:hypothetical protein
MRRLTTHMIPSSRIEAATSRIANVEPKRDIRRSAAKQFLNSLVLAIAARWPEYSIEAALLCLFMLSACTITTRSASTPQSSSWIQEPNTRPHA